MTRLAVSRNVENASENGALFALLVDSVKDYAIFLMSPNGTVLSWNAGAARLKGYSAEEILGEHFSRFYSPEDKAVGLPESILEKAAAEGRAEQEGWRVRKDGSRFWADAVVTALRDEKGMLVGFAKVTRDLSERRELEKAQRLSGAHMTAIVNVALDGIATINERGIVESFNPAAARTFGYEPEEVIGQNVRMLMPEPYHSAHDGYLAHYQETGEKKIIGIGREVMGRKKDGTTFPIELAVSEVTLEDRHLFVGTMRDITERKRAEEALRRAHDELERKVAERTEELARTKNDLHAIIDNLPALISYWDTDLRNRFSNQAYWEWFGIRPEQMQGKHVREVIGEDLFAANLPHIEAVMKGETQSFERTVTLPTGALRYSQASYIPDLREGRVQGYYILVTDITQRKQAELALFAEKERARVTLSSIGDGVITTDNEGRVTYLNPIAEEMTGWPSESAVGLVVEEVMVIHDTTTGEPITNPIRLALQENRIVGMGENCLLQGRGKGEYHIEDSAAPIRDSNGMTIGAVIVFHDVSEARAIAIKMSHMAQHDSLTNLPNRLLLHDRISQAIQFAKRNGTQFALLFLDLDHFKHINDSLGHAAGDDLLRGVAKRLSRCLRSSDTVSRQGGDEFVVLLSQVDSPDHTAQTVQRLLDAVAEPFELGEEALSVSFSIGISVYPDDGGDAETLMRRADAAMYCAKKAGRNRYQFFSSDMDEAVIQRHILEREMREALEEKQFSLYYQLKVDSVTNNVIGTEALVRWHRPGGEVYSPTRFIPLAEESGLIVPLGRFVLREACRQNRRWQVSGLPLIPVAVNISAAQLRNADFVPMVEGILSETGMAPQYLELEITEGTLIEAVEDARSTLEKLRAMGVRIALDDFGTGYSSLSHLKRFPVDTLKIDRSFVADLSGNASDSAIISAIVGMGRGLGLEVIAEGVETQEQADLLRGLQCYVMQGYLFSRPVTAEQATRIMKSRVV